MSTQNQNKLARQNRRRVGTVWRTALWFLVLCAAPLARAQESPAGPSSPPFRMGFSSSLFKEMNENDIKVFLRMWTETLAKLHGIPADPQPTMLEDSAALDQVLRSGQVDAAGMATVEHLALSQEMQGGALVLPVMNGEITEEYLLLAHRDGAVKSLQDLPGHSLVVFDNVRACLAPVWLETVLAQHGLTPGESGFSKVTRAKKLSQVVLSVFFRQTEVCLVTRNGFKTVSELNPQVGQQLRVLASSPAVVPSLFCFRPDYPPEKLKKIVAGATTLHQTPGGQQLQTIFKVDRMEAHPASCLDSARELLALHRRLCGATNGAAVKPILAHSLPAAK
jgi:phosphonate transport system substrate-binding protein